VFLENAPDNAPSAWFHGQVIDMLYFPIFEFVWPEWVPYVGGNYFEFFSPVFNIADSSIFIGVVIILFMQKKFFGEKAAENQPETDQSENQSPSENPQENPSPNPDASSITA
jgi:signal peptidase II